MHYSTPAALRTRHVLFIFSGAFTELEATLRQAPDAAAADATAPDSATAPARPLHKNVLCGGVVRRWACVALHRLSALTLPTTRCARRLPVEEAQGLRGKAREMQEADA